MGVKINKNFYKSKIEKHLYIVGVQIKVYTLFVRFCV